MHGILGDYDVMDLRVGMINKLQIVTFYSLGVAIVPIILFLNSYVAKASDVERTNAQIMLEVQQIGISNRRDYNDLRFNFGTNTTEEKHLLTEEKLMLMKQQLELDKLRQEIK